MMAATTSGQQQNVTFPQMEAVGGTCIRTRREPDGGGGFMVADLHFPGMALGDAEREALARLIVAAPDLLAAFEHVLDAFERLYAEAMADRRNNVEIVNVVNSVLSSREAPPVVTSAIALVRKEG